METQETHDSDRSPTQPRASVAAARPGRWRRREDGDPRRVTVTPATLRDRIRQGTDSGSTWSERARCGEQTSVHHLPRKVAVSSCPSALRPKSIRRPGGGSAHPCVALTGANPSPLIEEDATSFRGLPVVGSPADVSRWGQTRLYRVALLALFGALGVLVDARPAQAMGCHVRDRPVLGLSTSLESAISGQPDTAWIAHPSPRVRAAPVLGRHPRCAGTTPPSEPLAPPTPFTLEPAEARPIHGDATPSRPLAIPTRLDRPPRSRALSA